MAVKYCQGSSRQAERAFGWGRVTVELGLNELRTGIRCMDAYSSRGCHKTEDRNPALVEQIQALVEPHTQADPKFQTPLAYTRITAKAVRQQLVAHAAETGQPVPAERTVHDILNRLGYRLRRVRKTKPQKKSPKPIPSSSTCSMSTRSPHTTRKHSGSRSTPKPK